MNLKGTHVISSEYRLMYTVTFSTVTTFNRTNRINKLILIVREQCIVLDTIDDIGISIY